MPKDLTKLSIREFDSLSTGEFDQRTRWHNGTLERVVSQAPSGSEQDDYDRDD
ncbi:MAG TPA: hypothetical protein V6D47_18010 [Oscillatoriaceae cyanobacterium]